MPKRVSIRNLSEQAHAKLSMGARLRGITEAEYLERLLELHERMRTEASPAMARNGHTTNAYAILNELGLQTVKQEG